MGGVNSKPTPALEKDEKTRTLNTKSSMAASSTAVVLRNNNPSSNSSLLSNLLNKFKKKKSAEEIIKEIKAITLLPKDLIRLLFQYDGRYYQDNLLFKAFLPSVKEEILIHIVSAGPFDQLQALIKKYEKSTPAEQLEKLLFNEVFTIHGMQGTLIELSIICLDQTINKNEGMAEWLINFARERFPDRYQDAITQAKKALFVEENEQKQKREATNLAAVEKVFNAFKSGGEKVTEETIIFEEYVHGSKKSALNEKGYLTDNRYYLNLLHLVYCAFDVLARRGDELQGGWHDVMAEQFCFKIIGGVLQFNASARLQQIFKKSVAHMVKPSKKANHIIDRSRVGSLLFGHDSLRLNVCRDMFGLSRFLPSASTGRAPVILNGALLFSSLIKQYRGLHGALQAPVAQLQQPNIMAH